METTTVMGKSSSGNPIKQDVKVSPIEFSRVFTNDYQKEGTITLEIKQTVETVSHYPSKRVESNLQSNFFAAEEFGFTDQDFTSKETRVAWLLVPEKASKEILMQKIAEANKDKACIYRVLSNQPILNEDQKYAIETGLKTLEDFAKSQVVRYPANYENPELAGKVIPDPSGKLQFRRTFFWKTPMKDMDIRDKNPENAYTESADLNAELNGAAAYAGQTL